MVTVSAGTGAGGAARTTTGFTAGGGSGNGCGVETLETTDTLMMSDL
jgi:hypothetical protein